MTGYINQYKYLNVSYLCVVSSSQKSGDPSVTFCHARNAAAETLGNGKIANA